ncbi:type I-F CRISPR-associated endoribonuclease Cas6/Csy4 (plasmid) [Vibrio cyclitrophicus]|uniref:type I-F CRISPR-associated endoribonuclease Cas6/Csy4 n=2 Tax=Vibrio TaxID=662 RepID=UPI000C85C5CF|nr:type I-F CRISPR-associated endoribonuclease Cas6/Csy4 [Vibrio cyclitrophicus]PMJ45142.1 type I-F CRISPR-associated endoribonuclease Cas6/Csy4 [Vibrio cyclitrophicus]
MNYYQEITLLPDAEISLGFIWQNVFQQVHIALVDNKVAANQSAIAVGFPEYGKPDFPLGTKLRLFSKEQSKLETLAIEQRLSRLEDYVHIKGVKVVPDEANYVSFTRKQVKSPERIERDMQKKAELWSAKSGMSLQECLVELEKTKPTSFSSLPFIYLHSQQTKQRSPDKCSKFPLFIEMNDIGIKQEGYFDCYGLNAKLNQQDRFGTVPQF